MIASSWILPFLLSCLIFLMSKPLPCKKKIEGHFNSKVVPCLTCCRSDLLQYKRIEDKKYTKIPRVGVLLGILGRGVPPGSSNLDPISDQNIPFSTPVFRPLLYRNNFIIKLRISQELVKFSSNDIFWILLFLYHSFGVEKTIRLYAPVVPLKTIKTIMDKIYTRFQTKTAQKPYPLGRHIPI